MNKLKAVVVSVHAGASGQFSKNEQPSIMVEIEGVVSDRHGSPKRATWALTDKQPEGTVRRNERLWSAVSVEDLVQITEDMDLIKPLTAAAVSANLCFEGIPEFSRLPRGTTFRFPAGAELQSRGVQSAMSRHGQRGLLSRCRHDRASNLRIRIFQKRRN